MLLAVQDTLPIHDNISEEYFISCVTDGKAEFAEFSWQQFRSLFLQFLILYRQKK
jgi:hypothetical protein